jgi:hypothetical protein
MPFNAEDLLYGDKINIIETLGLTSASDFVNFGVEMKKFKNYVINFIQIYNLLTNNISSKDNYKIIEFNGKSICYGPFINENTFFTVFIADSEENLKKKILLDKRAITAFKTETSNLLIVDAPSSRSSIVTKKIPFPASVLVSEGDRAYLEEYVDAIEKAAATSRVTYDPKPLEKKLENSVEITKSIKVISEMDESSSSFTFSKTPGEVFGVSEVKPLTEEQLKAFRKSRELTTLINANQQALLEERKRREEELKALSKRAEVLERADDIGEAYGEKLDDRTFKTFEDLEEKIKEYIRDLKSKILLAFYFRKGLERAKTLKGKKTLVGPENNIADEYYYPFIILALTDVNYHRIIFVLKQNLIRASPYYDEVQRRADEFWNNNKLDFKYLIKLFKFIGAIIQKNNDPRFPLISSFDTLIALKIAQGNDHAKLKLELERKRIPTFKPRDCSFSNGCLEPDLIYKSAEEKVKIFKLLNELNPTLESLVTDESETETIKKVVKIMRPKIVKRIKEFQSTLFYREILEKSRVEISDILEKLGEEMNEHVEELEEKEGNLKSFKALLRTRNLELSEIEVRKLQALSRIDAKKTEEITKIEKIISKIKSGELPSTNIKEDILTKNKEKEEIKLRYESEKEGVRERSEAEKEPKYNQIKVLEIKIRGLEIEIDELTQLVNIIPEAMRIIDSGIIPEEEKKSESVSLRSEINKTKAITIISNEKENAKLIFSLNKRLGEVKRIESELLRKEEGPGLNDKENLKLLEHTELKVVLEEKIRELTPSKEGRHSRGDIGKEKRESKKAKKAKKGKGGGSSEEEPEDESEYYQKYLKYGLNLDSNPSSNISFKEKYLKYKSKYLKLKQELGL